MARCGFRYENKLRAIGVIRIAGIDEAGRGALAGPVVAAAVILPEKFRHDKLKDSKQLAPDLREEVYEKLVNHAEIQWAIGVVDHAEIDQINILRATHKAMRLAMNRPRSTARSRFDRRPSGVAFPIRADSNCRRRLHQQKHRCRQRDRQGQPGSDDARLLRHVSGILLQPAQGLQHRTASAEAAPVRPLPHSSAYI